jgi:hypothetical protein
MMDPRGGERRMEEEQELAMMMLGEGGPWSFLAGKLLTAPTS